MPNPKMIEKQIEKSRAKKNADATKAGAKKLAKAKGAPASVRAKNSETTISERVTDADRLHTFVVSILEKWRIAKENNLEGSNQNIIKVSMREINLVMSRSLKNTRVSRLHDLINDTLSGLDIVDVYGSWVFVDWDTPDCLFIRLPDTKTNVVSVRIGRTKGSDDYALYSRTERLIQQFVENEDEDDEDRPDYTSWSDKKLRFIVERLGLNKYGTEGNESTVDINSYDRAALIRLLVESDE